MQVQGASGARARAPPGSDVHAGALAQLPQAVLVGLLAALGALGAFGGRFGSVARALARGLLLLAPLLEPASLLLLGFGHHATSHGKRCASTLRPTGALCQRLRQSLLSAPDRHAKQSREAGRTLSLFAESDHSPASRRGFARPTLRGSPSPTSARAPCGRSA